jgi:hypothetical protein
MRKTLDSAVARVAGALITFLGVSAGAVGPSIWFDFEPAEPDPDGFFGTHQPGGTFDDQASAGSFQVTSAYLQSGTLSSSWIVLNDTDIDTNNPAAPADDSDLRALAPVTLRTRIEHLTSSTSGEASAAGFIFGLSDAGGASASGWLARVERVPGGNTGRLYLDAFMNGARGTNVLSSATFSYGNFNQPWFLDLRLMPGTNSTAYSLGIIADTNILGSGRDPLRLSSASFEDAPRAAVLAGSLPGTVTGLSGLHFEDNSLGAGSNPSPGIGRFSNFYIRTGTPTTNADYRIDLASGGALALTNIASGLGAVFEPKFTVLYSLNDPGLGQDDVIESRHGTVALGYQVPTWSSGGGGRNVWSAPEATIVVTPRLAGLLGGRITYRFKNDAKFSFAVDGTLPLNGGDPELALAMHPRTNGYFAAGYTGAPSIPSADADWIWQPLIWQGKRFPATGYLIPEYHCPVPAVMVNKAGTTWGVVADPQEMPFRLPTFDNSRFGVALRKPGSMASPVLFAPMFGGAGSFMNTGGSFGFRFHLFARPGDFYANYTRLARDTYGFHDYRENTIATLNDTLDNMQDYFLTPYAEWDANARGFSGLRDDPGTVKSYSPVHLLSWAMVRDSELFFEQRARPSIEYSLSRSAYFLTINGYDPKEAMFGPALNALTPEYVALYHMSGGRTAFFRKVAEDLNFNLAAVVDTNATYTRQQSIDNGRNYLRRYLAMYQLTGDPEYLNKACKVADDYITWRINQPQTDFYDGFNTFWYFIGPMWVDLLELHAETGIQRYQDAALAGAREFAGYSYYCPAIPETNVTVNIGGSVSGMPIPQETVPAWRVAEMGLQCEAANTSTSHRGIFMVPWAAYFNRLTLASGDTFFRDAARSAIVGRYANFPGYNHKTVYTTIYEKPDYPLKSFQNLTFNSFHYHHPMLMAVELIDYLVSEAGLRSGEQIGFPSRYSATAAYFQQKVYGDRPGQFYNRSNVWLWMPQRLLTNSSVQVNYLAARGDSNLCVALMNQSTQAVTTTVSLNPSLVAFGASHSIQVRTNNVEAPQQTLTAGSVTVNVAPKGITTLEIDGVTPQVTLQQKYLAETPSLGDQSYAEVTTAEYGKVQGCLMSFGPELTSAYVWLQACPENAVDARSGPLKRATLHYSVDQGPTNTMVDTVWPFEFTVPLTNAAGQFHYWVDGLTPSNQVVSSPTATLFQHYSYGDWVAFRFTAAEQTNALISGMAADPDLDGILNAAEYALGLMPKMPDPSPLQAEVINGVLQVSYPRNTLASQVTVTPEISDDLSTWNSGPAHLEVLSEIDLGGGVIRVTLKDIAGSGARQRFVRLRIESH